MSDRKRDYRTGTITIKQAKERFNEYYNNRTNSAIGAFRAKLFDKMYQKKPKFTIKCDVETGQCEKGSEKYLLEEGPRTFDIEGIDSFPEDTEFELNNKMYKSRGATHKRDGEADKDVYGPRIKSSKKLYAEHFKEKYNQREDDKNLVDIYWDKYRNEKKELDGIEDEQSSEYYKKLNSMKYSRKNKKNKEKITKFKFASFDDNAELYSIKNNNFDKIYDENNEVLDDSYIETQITFLEALNIIIDSEENIYKFNKSIAKSDVIKITFEDNNVLFFPK